MGILAAIVADDECARGIGIACYGCCVGTARQPEVQGRLFTNFIIGAALAEALALIGFVLAFIL